MADELPELTDKRARFIDEYLKDCNATQAAIRAGYAEGSARQEGSRLLSNVNIRAEIDRRLTLLGMPAAEVIKHFSDIAVTRLNEFMYTTPVQGYEQVEQYVTILITHTRNEIKLTEAFIGRNRLTKETRKPFDAKVARLYEQVAEYEALVEKWGDDVTLVVPGRPVVHHVTHLDLPALARAKDVGRIKKFKHTKEGVEIEMLDAQAALRDLGRIHGIFEKDNRQAAGTDVEIIIGGSPAETDA